MCTSATKLPIVLAPNLMSSCLDVEHYYCWRCSVARSWIHRCRVDWFPLCRRHHRCNRHCFDCLHCHYCNFDRLKRPAWWSKIYSICDSISFDGISLRRHYDPVSWLSMWLVWMWLLSYAQYSMWHLDSITLPYLRCHLNCLRVSQFDMLPSIRDMPVRIKTGFKSGIIQSENYLFGFGCVDSPVHRDRQRIRENVNRRPMVDRSPNDGRVVRAPFSLRWIAKTIYPMPLDTAAIVCNWGNWSWLQWVRSSHCK